MKESCLHCQLIQVVEKWLKTHNASTEEICSMVGRAASQAISNLPEYRDLAVDVIIFGIKHSHHEGTLH